MQALTGYDWPGNVRELVNIIQRAYVLCDDPVIEVRDLPSELFSQPSRPDAGDDRFLTLEEITHLYVRKALCSANGVQSQAAKMLGIGRTSLWRMIPHLRP